jgi:plastocyanin
VSRRLIASAFVGVVALGLTASGAAAAEPTIEATGSSLASYAWTPSTAEVGTGESVSFKNPTANFHALAWESGPQTPSCTGTPSAGQANWSGSCTFAQGGTYKFYCPVHPAQMKGTIAVSGPAAPLVFEYGTTTGYGQKTAEASAGSGTSSVDRSVAVNGLTPSTTYHFRMVAKNPSGTSFGSDRTFTTTGPPSATTGLATDVTDSAARLNGSYSPGGFQAAYFFEYGTTTAYGSKTGPGAAGNGTGISFVSMGVAGLSPQTTYHFQLVAESAAGTAFGGDQTFTTAPVSPLESAAAVRRRAS